MYQTFVILNHNRAEFIDRAIRSCLSQLFFRKDFEIIVVDDSSTDNSLEIISEFKNEIKLIKNNKQMGVGYCSNQALDLARGKYWMRVDSDDFLNAYSGPISSMIMDDNPNISFVYSDYFKVDIRGVKIEKIKLDSEKKRLEYGAGVNFRKSILSDIKGYDSSLKNCEDYDLFLRLKKANYSGFYLPIPLYRYYIHGKNITLTKQREIIKKKVIAKHGI